MGRWKEEDEEEEEGGVGVGADINFVLVGGAWICGGYNDALSASPLPFFSRLLSCVLSSARGTIVL